MRSNGKLKPAAWAFIVCAVALGLHVAFGMAGMYWFIFTGENFMPSGLDGWFALFYVSAGWVFAMAIAGVFTIDGWRQE